MAIPAQGLFYEKLCHVLVTLLNNGAMEEL